jgi:hypothetical protein
MAKKQTKAQETPAQAQVRAPKIGAGHAKAMLRQGFKELAQIVPAFPSQGIQPVEEPGLAGNPTQPAVSQQMGLVMGSTYAEMLAKAPKTASKQKTKQRGIER